MLVKLNVEDYSAGGTYYLEAFLIAKLKGTQKHRNSETTNNKIYCAFKLIQILAMVAGEPVHWQAFGILM
jgi:hypothetical protein